MRARAYPRVEGAAPQMCYGNLNLFPLEIPDNVNAGAVLNVSIPTSLSECRPPLGHIWDFGRAFKRVCDGPTPAQLDPPPRTTDVTTHLGLE